MGTGYVYAPFSGTITQCNSGSHTPCTDGGSPSTHKPVDISAAAGTSIRLYVNYPSIRCVSWQEDTSGSFECCDGQSVPTDLKRAIRVWLYGKPNFECPVGWVLFGHINKSGFSIPNGNISQNYVGKLGTIINASGYGCYSGPHLHMEVSSAWGYNSGCSTGSSVTGGTTRLYKQDFSCPIQG